MKKWHYIHLEYISHGLLQIQNLGWLLNYTVHGWQKQSNKMAEYVCFACVSL